MKTARSRLVRIVRAARQRHCKRIRAPGACLLAAALAILPASTANAVNAEDVYLIEFVVFVDDRATRRDEGGLAPGDEQWRNPELLAYPEKLAFLRSADQPVTSAPGEPPLLQLLDVPGSEISAIANTLRQRSRYRVLFEGSWLQELTDRDRAPAVPLFGGKRFEPWYELMGTVTFSKERYLHITTDLWFSEFAPQGSFAADQPWYVSQASVVKLPLPAGAAGASSAAASDYVAQRSYTLAEFRRLRRDQLNYLDHPVFGAIVKVSRYDAPQQDTADSGAQDLDAQTVEDQDDEPLGDAVD